MADGKLGKKEKSDMEPGHSRLAVLFALLVVLGTTAAAAPPSFPARQPLVRRDFRASDGAEAPVWKEVPILTRFTSLTTHDLAVDQTEVQMLACDEGLAVRFTCHDAEPQRIMATQLVRNADQGFDDTVSFMLDTFRDGRGNYQFDVNPLGTQNGSNSRDAQWDEPWHAQARRTSDGWVALMVVPWRSIKYPRGGGVEWGFQFSRHLKRIDETSVWAYPDRDTCLTPQYFPRLAVEAPAPSLRPTVILTTTQTRPDGAGAILGGGADVKYPLTRDLTFNVSVMPDFSDSAQEQLLFTPQDTNYIFGEFRPFFQEGSAYFNTSGGGGFTMFNSSRIGSFNMGGRLTGKVGGATVGLLNVVGNDGMQDTVANVSTDLVPGKFTVGTLYETGQGQAAGSFYARDMLTRQINGFVEWGWAGDMSSANSAFQGSLSANSGELAGTVSYQRIGSSFNPLLGFYEINGIEGPSVYLAWNTRLLKHWERFYLAGDWSRMKDPAGNVVRVDESVYGGGKLRHSKWDFSFNAGQLTWLGFTDPKLGFGVGYNSDFPNNWGIAWSGGTYHGQPSSSVNLYGNLQPSPHLQLSLTYLTDDYLPYSTPDRNRVWHGGVTWLWSGTRSFTAALRETEGGTVNLYTVYRHELSWGKQLVIVVGDPNSPASTARFVVKIVNRL